MSSLARRVAVTCSAVIMLASTTIAVEATSSRGRTPGARVRPIFRPLLPRLAQASLPVYLPSWLPPHPRLYPALSFVSRTEDNFAPRVSGYQWTSTELATAAAAGGAPERAILRQTGHRSVEMVRRYIRAGSLFQENAAAYVAL